MPRDNPPSRILLAHDGSPGSLAPARWARGMMEEGAEVEVVTVAEMPMEYRTGYPGPLPSRETERPRVAEQLRRVRRALRRAGFSAPPPIQLATSTPARVIAGQAAESHAALVLVGLSRKSRVSRIFGDEVPVQVAQLSPVPVLAVPADRRWPPRRGAVAVDFSPESLEAVGFAARLLGDEGELRVVHVLPPAWRDLVPPEVRERIDEVVGRLEALTLDLAGKQGSAAASPGLLYGEPGRALVEFARAEELDLIALGSHGQGFVDRLLLGSTSRRVLRSAVCATLVIPHGWSAGG